MQILATLTGFALLTTSATAQYAPWAVSARYDNSKDCHQVACWISTSSRSCADIIANKMQIDLYKGRDAYRVEDSAPNGMWVRYWRTKFEPADRGQLVHGTCTDKTRYSVSICQSTGKVKC